MSADKVIPLTEAARDALEQRGIPTELAEQHGVVSVNLRHGQEWVGFRHRVDGSDKDHWAFRTIVGEKKFLQSKGTKKVFWNNEVIDDPELGHMPLVITEGHLDALCAINVGFKRVVSVPNGASGGKSDSDKGAFAFLDGTAFDKVGEVILAVDGDDPGLAFMHALALRIGRKKCRWVKWPDGCKDANDVLRNHDPETLVQCINGARWFKLGGLYTFDELPDEPEEKPVQIGIPGLDDLWKPSLGRMTVFTGIPSHGKTECLADISMNLAERHGWVCAVGSFEDKVKAMLVPRLQRWLLRADPKKVTADRLEQANGFIRRHFVFMQNEDDEDEPANVEWFLERVEAAVLRHNAKFVIADPWNELDHTQRPDNVSVTEYMNFMLGRIRRHAKTLNYHAVIAPHPTKLQKDKDGQYPIPTGYNISDSAAWVNKPDTGLSIYRHKDDSVTIGCWKCKSSGIIGQKGDRMFRFSPEIGRYDYAPDLEDNYAAA